MSYIRENNVHQCKHEVHVIKIWNRSHGQHVHVYIKQFTADKDCLFNQAEAARQEG